MAYLVNSRRNDVFNRRPIRKTIFVGQTRFTAVLTPDMEEGGYAVSRKEIPAAISQGETIEEAWDNLVDALELCQETDKELKGISDLMGAEERS